MKFVSILVMHAPREYERTNPTLGNWSLLGGSGGASEGGDVLGGNTRASMCVSYVNSLADRKGL